MTHSTVEIVPESCVERSTLFHGLTLLMQKLSWTLLIINIEHSHNLHM